MTHRSAFAQEFKRESPVEEKWQMKLAVAQSFANVFAAEAIDPRHIILIKFAPLILENTLVLVTDTLIAARSNE